MIPKKRLLPILMTILMVFTMMPFQDAFQVYAEISSAPGGVVIAATNTAAVASAKEAERQEDLQARFCEEGQQVLQEVFQDQ